MTLSPHKAFISESSESWKVTKVSFEGGEKSFTCNILRAHAQTLIHLQLAHNILLSTAWAILCGVHILNNPRNQTKDSPTILNVSSSFNFISSLSHALTSTFSNWKLFVRLRTKTGGTLSSGCGLRIGLGLRCVCCWRSERLPSSNGSRQTICRRLLDLERLWHHQVSASSFAVSCTSSNFI